jgi:hypothetical protein
VCYNEKRIYGEKEVLCDSEMKFQKLTLNEAPLLKEFFFKEPSRICDRTIGGAMMWRNCFQTHFSVDDDCLYLKSRLSDGRWAFTTPLGDSRKGLERIFDHCRATGEQLRFCSVPERELDLFLSLPRKWTITENRDWFDYVYFAEKLSTFGGKKLSGQRNHRNFFLKNHSRWHFEVLNEENLSRAMDFYDEYDQKTQKDSIFFQEERKGVLEVLSHCGAYGFLGGMIVAEGKTVALSLGEIVGDTLFVHIEKADRSVRGAYQMMVSEFISHFATPETVYVNREEDVGDPGLRYSKESYHPETLLKKFTIEEGNHVSKII